MAPSRRRGPLAASLAPSRAPAAGPPLEGAEKPGGDTWRLAIHDIYILYK